MDSPSHATKRRKVSHQRQSTNAREEREGADIQLGILHYDTSELIADTSQPAKEIDIVTAGSRSRRERRPRKFFDDVDEISPATKLLKASKETTPRSNRKAASLPKRDKRERGTGKHTSLSSIKSTPDVVQYDEFRTVESGSPSSIRSHDEFVESTELEDALSSRADERKPHANPVPKSQIARPEDVYKTANIIPDETQSSLFRTLVQQRLTGVSPMKLVGLEPELEKVQRLLVQTITSGEGNSMLIIGARGTGKTSVVENALNAVSQQYHDSFYVIRLNGFFQTDDKIALREIWRQLGREAESGEEPQARNYADTLATLLALLSHPSDRETSAIDQVAKAVVFILEEFDQFTTHSRQTLLYNLFDIAQSRKAPIAVLGLTTNVDIMESLEKRVKSRFSHRTVHLGLPKNGQAFLEICKAALRLEARDISLDEDRASIQTDKAQASAQSLDEAVAFWNTSVEGLLDNEAIRKSLLRIYHTSKSIPTALSTLLLPVASLSLSRTTMTGSRQDMCGQSLLEAPDSKLHLLPSLASLAMALLIAAARLEIILDSDMCNFNMAYDEYARLAGHAKMKGSVAPGGHGTGGKVWGKQTARAAWEKLLQAGLILLVGGAGLGGGNEMVRCDVALEELEWAIADTERAMARWCREI